jgi:hypothetical protein
MPPSLNRRHDSLVHFTDSFLLPFPATPKARAVAAGPKSVASHRRADGRCRRRWCSRSSRRFACRGVAFLIPLHLARNGRARLSLVTLCRLRPAGFGCWFSPPFPFTEFTTLVHRYGRAVVLTFRFSRSDIILGLAVHGRTERRWGSLGHSEKPSMSRMPLYQPAADGKI